MNGVFPNGHEIASDAFNPALTAGDDGTLMIRPEQMRISSLQGANGTSGLPVTVRDVTYLGDAMHYAVATPWQQEISIRMPAAHRHDGGIVIGTQALVDCAAHDVRLFAQA